MTAINAENLPPDQLATMLRTWAAGFLDSEAAVELLIAHDVWLKRRDFRAGLIDAIEDGWSRDGRSEPMASIRWQTVPQFLDQPGLAASASEVAVLRLAASMAGAISPSSLRELTLDFDRTNAGLVLDALAHRFGWHEHGHTHTVTGHLGPPHPRRSR